MTIKIKYLLTVYVLLSAFVITSCSSDDDTGPSGQFATGTFVINEGNFNDADGSITHYGPEATQNIFSSTNDGRVLGDVVQSMSIDGDLAYIVVNNSNKVEVVNAHTFVSEYTIEDVSLPRYFTTFNGKGYITEWVSFSDPGRVSVLNIEDRSIETTIETGFGAEYILAANGNLYVSNSFSTTISVIDPSANSVTNTIDLGAGVTQMVLDKNNKIWAISGGTTDYTVTPPAPNNDGKLFKIDPVNNSVASEVELNTNVSGRLVTNGAKDKLFFLKGNSVFSLSVDATSFSADALITEQNAVSFYGIGVDPQTGIIYAADSRAFQGNGEVYRYNADGSAIDNFTVGRGPNGFAFK